MSYKLVVEDAAVEDAAEIHRWYEQQRPGLGMQFLIALDECYTFIRSNPQGKQVRKGIYRYAQVAGFRYYRVVYAVDDHTVTVYQVRHTSRKPSKKFGP